MVSCFDLAEDVGPLSEGFERSVASPLQPRRLVRWDAQSDRFPPCQTIIPTAFRSQSGLPTNCPLSGQPISNEAVIGNSCRDWQLTSLSCGHAPSQFVEEVLEADYLAFLLGRFRGFHGVTGRAMHCSRGKSTGTLRLFAWKLAKRSVMVWNRFRTVGTNRFRVDCCSC